MKVNNSIAKYVLRALCAALFVLMLNSQSNAMSFTPNAIFTFDSDTPNAPNTSFGAGTSNSSITLNADQGLPYVVATFSVLPGDTTSAYAVNVNSSGINANNMGTQLMYGGWSGSYPQATPAATAIQISFLQPITGFSFDWMAGAYTDGSNFIPAPAGFTVSVYPNGSYTPVFLTSPVQSDTWSEGSYSYTVPSGDPLIDSFTFTSPAEYGAIIGFDNLQVGETPEPGILAFVTVPTVLFIGLLTRQKLKRLRMARRSLKSTAITA